MERRKHPILKVLLIIALLLVFGFFALAACSGNSYELSQEATLLSDEEYKELCAETTYDELARNSDNIIGEKVKITGAVESIEYDGGAELESEYTVAVVKDDDFDNENVEELGIDESDTYDILRCIYLYYCIGEGGRLLEDDIITIYGEVSGYRDYLGDDIPSITAVYVEMGEK